MSEREIAIQVTAENLPANAFAPSTQSVEGFRANVDKASQSTRTLGTTTNSSLTSMIPTLSNVAGAFGLTFGVGAIIGFSKEVMDSAGHIKDLSAKLAISTDAVQRYEYATKLSGGTVEGVSKAILTMSDRLANGDQSLVASLKNTTLTVAGLKAMGPEQAFEAMVEAVAKTKDPMDQARMAMDFFGKSGAELLPAIRDGFLDAANAAQIMSADTIDELDEAGDALLTFWTSVETMGGNVLGSTIRLFKDLRDSTLEWVASMQGKVLNSVREVTDNVKPLNTAMGLTARSVDDLEGVEDKLNKTLEKSQKETTAYRDKVQGLADTLTGRKLKEEVTLLAAAVKQAGREGGITAAETEKLGKKLSEMRENGAKLTPELKNLADDYDRQQELLSRLTPKATDILLLFRNQASAVETLHQKYLAAHPAIEQIKNDFDKLIVPVGEAHQLIGDINATPVHLEPPPLTPWEEFKGRVTDIYHGIVGDAGAAFANMLTGATGFKDGFLSIWDSIKQGVRQVLADLFADVVQRFLNGIINELRGGSFTSAFTGLFNGIGGGGSVTVPGGSGVGGVGGIGGGDLSGLINGVATGTYLTWFLSTFFSGGLHGNATQTGPSDLETAQGLFDYFGPGGDAFLAFMNEHPDLWGRGNGFRTGTPDLDYATFSTRGTPAMLHGEEAVIPRQGGGHRLAGEIAASLREMITAAPMAAGAIAQLTIQNFIGEREIKPMVLDIVNVAGANGQIQISARQVTPRNPRG